MKRIISFLISIMAITTTMALPQPTTRCFVQGDEPLYLDHYRADVEGLRPCVLFAFGGGFSRGSRTAETYRPYFEMLLAEGFDVVAIDYRLGMKYTLNTEREVGAIEGAVAMYRSVNYATEDMLRATRFILDNAEAWQIDTTRIVASGSSAGAIASLQAENYICNEHRYASILPKGFNFAGVVAFAGAIYSFFGAPDWGRMPCPLMMFHGNSDRNVPYSKATILGTGFYGSAYIAEQLVEMRDASLYFYSATYRDHAMAVEPMNDNHEEIRSFLHKCVVAKEKWRNITDVISPDIEPQQTQFSIQEYLNANYAPEPR